MDIASYFTLLQYILMSSTLVVLILVFLYSFFGKEEETS